MKTSRYLLLGFSGLLLILLGGLMVYYQNTILLLITFGILAGLVLTYQLTTIKKIIDKGLLMVEAIGNEDLGFLHAHNFKLFDEHYQHRLQKLYHSFSKIKKESLKQEKYLSWLVENQDVGICTYNEEGHVIHVNTSFKEKVKLSTLTHIQQLFNKSIVNKSVVEKALIENSYQLPDTNMVLKIKKLKRENQLIHLLTLQDLSTELDEKENTAYNKLIRVLTHEIMNGMTPIISLTDSLLMSFTKEGGEAVDKEYVSEKMLVTNAKSLKIIYQQAQHLMNFTETYRSITKLPTPKIETIHVDKFLTQQLTSFQNRLHQQQVQTNIINVDKSEIVASFDTNLIGQCVNNIIKNALDAMENVSNPKLQITFQKKDQLIIHITNNGPMIPEEELKHIFVPFFTTKTSGDGIGLSLSKQIIRVHHGSLNVISTEEKTEFILKL
ncbi:sensor histidine kinase [Flammeovirga agarivorans]|uniref:histidine kinase n=1 Tax=Flammeovirga agarivorans TaxID=2726742 RepID=A0A7X8SMC6_9BACT|nr:HAMP domain-containing sensor histidine kinase [Flammeovirga agarivorans]NLR92815.1 HAMP domain-containing histidine kinase [Flammeovirga agarivorans]